MTALLLETKNLSAQYGKINALNNVNLKLSQGQVITVIGANGAGKSTLLNSIMGSLAASGVAQGDVLYQGSSIMTDKALAPKSSAPDTSPPMAIRQNIGHSAIEVDLVYLLTKHKALLGK